MRLKRTIIHCSYHKNLTHYFGRIMARFGPAFDYSYRHFASLLEPCLASVDEFDFVSLNNVALPLDRLDADTRVSRFVRDPRDLVVSGYHYHRKGVEAWTRIVDPKPADFKGVNGVIPRDMPPATSFSQYLSSIPMEQGLLAELEFRGRHFETMRDWPDDARILWLRYEDILGSEHEVFTRIAEHYGLPPEQVEKMADLAHALRAAERADGKDERIRDPRPSQWRNAFTPEVTRAFEDCYDDVLDRYGYAR